MAAYSNFSKVEAALADLVRLLGLLPGANSGPGAGSAPPAAIWP